ncbi:hypothetical protein EDB86DRAFT_3076349 [Lactarius hatsudake]|nr:hypothetical protein EDB86DRAFT_3076349 [Lactarius hatsudake]
MRARAAPSVYSKTTLFAGAPSSFWQRPATYLKVEVVRALPAKHRGKDSSVPISRYSDSPRCRCHVSDASRSFLFFKSQAIFYASMKEYEKKTKKDLLAHPLMAQLQTCNSPTDILAVLRTQVQQFEQSMSND